jgi:hypothetical protein
MKSAKASLVISSDSICNYCNANFQRAGPGRFRAALCCKDFCPALKRAVVNGGPVLQVSRIDRHADSALEILHE